MTRAIRLRPLKCRCGAEGRIEFAGGVAVVGSCLFCDRASVWVFTEDGVDSFTDPEGWYKPLVKELRMRFKGGKK